MSDTIEMKNDPDPLDYAAKMNELKRAGSKPDSESTPILGGGGGSMDSAGIYEKILQPCLAELAGVAFFVFVGATSAATDQLLLIAVAHGLALAIAIGSLGIISGGHLNPAVTVGVAIAGGIAPGLALLYILSQLIGAILGAALCRGVLNYTSAVLTASNATQTVYEQFKGGAHALGPNVEVGTATLAEIVVTTLLVLVVLMTAVRKRSAQEKVVAPVFIGLVVLVGILAIGPVTGGSMNPARSFGPAVVFANISSSVWHHHWIYWVGPIVGAIFAGFAYRLLLASPDKRLLFKRD